MFEHIERYKTQCANASTKTKLKRTNVLRESAISVDEFTFTTKMSKKSGQTEAIKLLKEATEAGV